MELVLHTRHVNLLFQQLGLCYHGTSLRSFNNCKRYDHELNGYFTDSLVFYVKLRSRC